MKTLSILGSTGSIGVQVLDLVSRFPDRFSVVGLSAGRNLTLLKEQILRFRPRWVAVASEREAAALQSEISPNGSLTVLWGQEGHEQVATLAEADLVVSAMVGAVGLRPTLAAVKAGKIIALANKEPLVMAGGVIISEARRSGATLLPVDSEHSAIFQVIQGQQRGALKKIILTASGGPFRDASPEHLARVTRRQALAHPRWKMGPKITVDSATLMNKGLEVMEACWLFDLNMDQVSICIHPQSIVHSLVEFHDGSVLAQMGNTDMLIPIAYALSFPERLPLNLPPLDLTTVGELTFYPPDLEKFPCLRLALEAGRVGGTMPVALNAANEVAVYFFLSERLSFQDIPRVIEHTMTKHRPVPAERMDEIMTVDAWARATAEAFINDRQGR